MSIPIESATTITLASGASDSRVIVSEAGQPYNYLYMAVTSSSGGVADVNPTLREIYWRPGISATFTRQPELPL